MAHHLQPGRARASDTGRRAGAADCPVGQRRFRSDDLSGDTTRPSGRGTPAPAPNGFFTVVSSADQPPGTGDWTSFATLAMEPRPKVSATRQVLAATAGVPATDVGWREAASVDFLGLASRVLSPALLTAATQRLVPVLDAAATWCAPAAAPGEPMQLAWRPQRFAGAGAAALVPCVIDPVVTPVLQGYASTFGLSPKVLWGNVCSALVGAATALHRAGVAVSVNDLLRSAPLEGTALTLPPHFRRASCCLYYRLPGSGLCADCVLTSAPRRLPAESG